MASAPQLQSQNNARSYFAQFNYPITLKEAIYWQSPISPPKFPPLRLKVGAKGVLLRRLRKESSAPKWLIAKSVRDQLSRISTIQAIFVTGALSMDNCPEDDDIDLMIITSANTLWLTRILVVSYLTFKNLRRPPSLPEHSSPRVKDKICDNLYLDTDHLALPTHNLYVAHEALQAKCIFDRGGIHHEFLSQNSWVKKYLPVAYRESLKKVNHPAMKPYSHLLSPLFIIINSLLFFVQYLFMKPKMTNEKVSLGSAFFHPRQLF